MELSHILAFNAALLAAWIAPGPAMLYALRTSLASGRAAGIAAGVGLGAVAALWTLAALLGLDALFARFPWAYAGLKIGAALYLIWIAVQTWRSAGVPVGTEGPDGGAAAGPRGRAGRAAQHRQSEVGAVRRRRPCRHLPAGADRAGRWRW